MGHKGRKILRIYAIFRVSRFGIAFAVKSRTAIRSIAEGRKMDDNKFQSATPDVKNPTGQRDKHCRLSREQFSLWLELSLIELEQEFSLFTTANSNRGYFKR